LELSPLPRGLFLSPPLAAHGAPHRDQDFLVFNGIIQPQEAMDLSDTGQSTAQRR